MLQLQVPAVLASAACAAPDARKQRKVVLLMIDILHVLVLYSVVLYYIISCYFVLVYELMQDFYHQH